MPFGFTMKAMILGTLEVEVEALLASVSGTKVQWFGPIAQGSGISAHSTSFTSK